ncbi:FkbM family methyltransferase [Pseudomonas aeruginosa]|nr:FkbM family methyltransferase [Pseudomonas aeruginosa]
MSGELSMMAGNDMTQADFLSRCERSGYLLVLVPSSYLGGVFRSQVVAGLSQRLPEVRLIAVDDVLFASNSVPDGFDQVIPTAQLKEPCHAGKPAVNCAYSLPTWLTLDHLAKTAQCITLDLPELLYLLDIPLGYQTGALTRELAMQHHAEFVSLRERLADERSRKTLEAIMRLRLDGNRAALLDVLCPGEQEYFSLYRGPEHPIVLRSDEHYVDIGAYDGDTVKKFMLAARHEYASIHAFEPDPANYRLMHASLAGSVGLHLHNQAVSDTGGHLAFAAHGTMGSRVEIDGTVQVPCVRLDDLLDVMTLLKMDVEGHEARVLRGAARLIDECRPRMAITCYHHVQDLLDIVAAIDGIAAGARLRLRHYSLYFYDTILYVDWPDALREGR